MMFGSQLISRLHGSLNRAYWVIVCYFITFSPFAAGATPGGSVSGLDAQSMLERIVGQVPNLMRMITAIAYVLGIYFMVFSLLKFKEFGEQRTMMSSQHHLKEPLIYMSVGVFLVFLPSAVQTGLSTFWTDPSPYAYLDNTDPYSQIWNNALIVVQLFGTIAFIRGLVMLSHLGKGGHGQASAGKAMTHIVGGIMCINIYQFIQMVFATLGVSVNFS
jgi:intracellular multiplication protein IcmC